MRYGVPSEARQPVDLSATGRVVLGLIPFGRRTGYDIKTFVDRTTRLFLGGELRPDLPELKRLEEQGLVGVAQSRRAGAPAPSMS